MEKGQSSGFPVPPVLNSVARGLLSKAVWARGSQGLWKSLWELFREGPLLFTKPQAQGALFIVNSTCFPSLLK